jgi:CHAD domain-containing protein
MAYEFGANENVREAILRCASEQLDRAVAELSEGINRDPARAVHNARKAIKKERSLLRLARGAMPAKQRRRENAALRDAARGLSGARDAVVMSAALDGVASHFAGQLPSSTFDAIGEQLESRQGRAAAGSNGSALEPQAVQELGAVRLRVEDWKISDRGWEALEAGLSRSFKQGRKAFAGARRSKSSEAMHAWRKRVKDLWYQQRLLAEICGPTVRGQAKDAHRLADLLGDEHDLSVVRDELTERPMPVAADVDAVVRLLDLRREELQAQAFHLGERVYAESPKAYRRRMRRLWKAGRALALEPVEARPAIVAAATREPGAAA